MDEAEKYQQRLQAIAERRHLQEAEERLKRETEDEWLKLAQKKRKSLRDQWFSDHALLPALDGQEQHTVTLRTQSQKSPEEEQNWADVREDKQQTQRREHKVSVNSTDTTPLSYTNQTSAEEKVLQQVSGEAQMAQRMFHESGQDGRSVLGMVAVQVERDPKTGATVVRSVGPVSAPAAAAMATAVFDDGRVSVHAVGGQPSDEELGQVLSAIDGAGMTALLDEVTVSPPRGQKTAVEDSGTSKQMPCQPSSALNAVPMETGGELRSSGGLEQGAEPGLEGCAERRGEEEVEENGQGGDSMAVMREVSGEVVSVEDQEVAYRMEDGPVTLTFLGYADAASGRGGALAVERVMITDEGEEKVLGLLMPASPPASNAHQDLVEEAAKGTQEGLFQDISLDGNGVQGQEAEMGRQNSASPDNASKRKTCQCCAVM